MEALYGVGDVVWVFIILEHVCFNPDVAVGVGIGPGSTAVDPYPQVLVGSLLPSRRLKRSWLILFTLKTAKRLPLEIEEPGMKVLMVGFSGVVGGTTGG